MRKFKFRVWDETEEKMHILDGMYFYVMVDRPTVLFESPSETVRIGWDRNESKFRLMQWTGLQDKEGVDIYEGDIIKTPYTYYDVVDWAIRVPYTEYVLGEVMYDVQKASFGLKIPIDLEDVSAGFNTFERLYDELDFEKSVVVGNVYETPELLKKEEE